jgi:CubicO group peptidase (beta-lactamase class C family)
VRIVRGGSGAAKASVVAEGVLHGGNLSAYFPDLEATFDFHRVKSDAASDFYPRGRPTATYTYTPPRPGDDGWPTASVEDVGMSRAAISKFVQMLIDAPIDSVHAQEVHGVLIARHGKLVLEEYFHGEHRDKPHDTRSAAKSLTATLAGAAIRSGVPLDVSTPVYRAMNGGEFPPDLEPRKRAVTLEHLLTMASGLDCDDHDPASVGNEDRMQEQTTQPDWYRYTLDLRMVRDPGAKSVYGSASPNLAGGVLARVAGRSLPELFHELLAEPLGIRRYHMNLMPTGAAYMGGGVRFLPRDFMKLGQLHVSGGTWNGRQVLTPEWCRRATSSVCKIGDRQYGYLWWVADYPYRGRTLRAFFAGGNGGQIVMGIPELDLVVAFYGGNYSDPALFVPQREYVPKYILPAVDGAK